MTLFERLSGDSLISSPSLDFVHLTRPDLSRTLQVYSFGVLMWEMYRCMPPWVKTETGYALNKRFKRFPFDSPRIYVALCAR